jgi:hypothetical protein
MDPQSLRICLQPCVPIFDLISSFIEKGCEHRVRHFRLIDPIGIQIDFMLWEFVSEVIGIETQCFEFLLRAPHQEVPRRDVDLHHAVC